MATLAPVFLIHSMCYSLLVFSKSDSEMMKAQREACTPVSKATSLKKMNYDDGDADVIEEYLSHEREACFSLLLPTSCHS